jgi:hypothetical protein
VHDRAADEGSVPGSSRSRYAPTRMKTRFILHSAPQMRESLNPASPAQSARTYSIGVPPGLLPGILSKASIIFAGESDRGRPLCNLQLILRWMLRVRGVISAWTRALRDRRDRSLPPVPPQITSSQTFSTESDTFRPSGDVPREIRRLRLVLAQARRPCQTRILAHGPG